jgi:hypothetical protein
MQVNKSKRGLSIFESSTFTDPVKSDCCLPILNKKALGGEFDQYLDLGVAHQILDSSEKNDYHKRKELVKLIYKNPVKKLKME